MHWALKRHTELVVSQGLFHGVRSDYVYRNHYYALRTWQTQHHMSRYMRFPTIWYVRPAKPQISLRIRAYDQSLC